LVLLVSGCSGFVDQDQAQVDDGSMAALEPDHPLGQTFVARHGGFKGLEIWLAADEGSQGEIILHLRSEPEAQQDIVTATLSLAQVTEDGFYRFSFPALRDSHSQYYYAFLEVTEESQVRVGKGSGDAYLDGALYRKHKPLDAQLAFRLVYDPGLMTLELAEATVRGAFLLTVAGLLYIVPGWALLEVFWHWRLPWAEKLGLAAGLSLAFYPLLFLWTDLVGLHLGSLYAWIPVTAGAVTLVWKNRSWQPRTAYRKLRRWMYSRTLWRDLTLLALLALLFAIRLLVIRSLDAPMWGDSYQHTMITQLLLDNDGLFDSWEPYVPYRSLTVHFGFHADAALFAWITGLGSPYATLVTGQIINGLATLAVYPLATRLADDNRWAGVGTVLVIGLLSPMPAEYVNWGRYAQLTGQAILPVALWLLWEAVQAQDAPWKAMLLASLVLAGMALSYYRMPFYYAAFVLTWLIVWGLMHWKAKAKPWLRGFKRLAIVATIALLFFAPWASTVSGGTLATVLAAGVTRASPLKQVLMSYRAWRRVARYVPIPLLAASSVAFVWSLVRRQWTITSVGLWVLALASLVAARLIHLPGANLMQHFAILIALYIPVGLLVGWLVGETATPIGRWTKQWLIGGVIAIVAVWAAARQMGIVKPSYVMVTRPDTRAMAWIRETTPSQACFLVEGFRIYDGRSAVGADAGWWIPLLASRQNTMPPQYALMNEEPVEQGYTRNVVDLVAHLETTALDSRAGMQPLCDWGITHVYVGQGQGETGAGAVQLFSPDALEGSPFFNKAYHQDRVRIFVLDSETCDMGAK
jgi:hypothetical protein